jgi:hypothetical protein
MMGGLGNTSRSTIDSGTFVFLMVRRERFGDE